MDPKRIIHRYLDNQRKALVAKLDGVSERDARWPMTQTGTNLLGLVKHVASIELGYFGEVFDRPSNVPLPWFDEGAETNADMWATAEESRETSSAVSAGGSPCRRHHRGAHARLAGRVPWWPPERQRSPCNRSWCMSRQKSLGMRGMPTSSASSSTARPATMTGTSPIRPHKSGRATACDSRGGRGSCAQRAEDARP